MTSTHEDLMDSIRNEASLAGVAIRLIEQRDEYRSMLTRIIQREIERGRATDPLIREATDLVLGRDSKEARA